MVLEIHFGKGYALEKAYRRKVWRRAKRMVFSSWGEKVMVLACESRSKKGEEFLNSKQNLRWAMREG